MIQAEMHCHTSTDSIGADYEVMNRCFHSSLDPFHND